MFDDIDQVALGLVAEAETWRVQARLGEGGRGNHTQGGVGAQSPTKRIGHQHPVIQFSFRLSDWRLQTPAEGVGYPA